MLRHSTYSSRVVVVRYIIAIHLCYPRCWCNGTHRQIIHTVSNHGVMITANSDSHHSPLLKPNAELSPIYILLTFATLLWFWPDDFTSFFSKQMDSINTHKTFIKAMTKARGQLRTNTEAIVLMVSLMLLWRSVLNCKHIRLSISVRRHILQTGLEGLVLDHSVFLKT